MDEVYCERFVYISCRGNKSVDYEIRKPNQKSTIVQYEENCPKRVMKNVGSGYLYCSFDLLRLCDKNRIIDSISRNYFEVDETETEKG